MATYALSNIPNNPYTIQTSKSVSPVSDRTSIFLVTFFGICTVVAIFLIFRFILLWYWRVNEIVKLLQDIKANTESNKKLTKAQP